MYPAGVAMETGSAKGYTAEEAAAHLSLQPEQVRDLIAAGALEVTGSGDDLRIKPESLLAYMMSRASEDVRRATARPRPLAIARDTLLPVIVALWFMGACVEVFSLRDGKPVAPVPAAIAALGAVLALAWWLARRADDIVSTQGVGTALYGRRMTPRGRVGTQWLVFCGVPLLPVRSYVILEPGKPGDGHGGAIGAAPPRLRPLERIHWPQALPVLGAAWAGIAALIALALLA